MNKKRSKDNLILTAISSAFLVASILLLACGSGKGGEMDTETNIQITESDDTLRNVNKCDGTEVAILRDKLESAGKNDILNFLKTLGVECRNAAEFSQVSNEVLFQILDSQPEKVIEVITQNISVIDTTEVFWYLEDPINDAIDVKAIIKKVEAVPNSDLKSKVLASLRVSVN